MDFGSFTPLLLTSRRLDLKTVTVTALSNSIISEKKCLCVINYNIIITVCYDRTIACGSFSNTVKQKK